LTCPDVYTISLNPKIFLGGVLPMDNVTYGLTMTILGMGGTIVSLWIISLAMNLLKRLFPYVPEKKEKTEEGDVGSH
jgi:hypothetical protein